MDKKSLILLIVCIVVFAFVALSYAGIFDHDETINVGKMTFKLPEGYKDAGIDKKGHHKITNGLDTILLKYDDGNISGHMMDYRDLKKSKNMTVNFSNFTVDGITAYKANCSDGTDQYWFVKGGKTYTFFTTKETYNIDDIARYLISSTKSK